jgi:hypothetical protein
MSKKPYPQNAKRGRPVTYTATVADAILDRIASGESLASICRDEGMPPAPTVRGWIVDDREGFAARSARAYALGYEAVAESCMAIADDGTNDWMERPENRGGGYEVNGEHIQRSRIRIDTRLRLLGKWAPKRYGEKLELAGDLNVKRSAADLSDEELAAIVAGGGGASTKP